MIFWMVAVMILEPPAAPITRLMVPSGFSTIVGEMELKGRLPGLMKLASEGTLGCRYLLLVLQVAGGGIMRKKRRTVSERVGATRNAKI